MITERQKDILNGIIKEYISSADPISSQLLEEKYELGICPATIRSEMQKLTNEGFLCQPHTSAGRIPTDKGYEFFVEKLFEEMLSGQDKSFNLGDWLWKESEDISKLASLITKDVAEASSNLALTYLVEDEILWKEGWENILKEPEFEEKRQIEHFIDFLKSFEANIKETCSDRRIQIYIGKNPFSKFHDFSIILSSCRFPKKQKGFLAILGPKRMNYDRNISLINFAVKNLENI